MLVLEHSMGRRKQRQSELQRVMAMNEKGQGNGTYKVNEGKMVQGNDC